ncbi:MAG TPA: hypothetical protein VF595_08070 [Tepidisphaeraceae bacterium]
MAGSARAADLPPAVREAAAATGQRGAIDAYIKGQFERIATGKGAGAARDELGRQCDANQAVTPSSSFQSEYISSLVRQIDPLLADKTEKALNVRLNAAVVVGRLCRATRLGALDPVAQRLMSDPSSAVALWGVKGGAELLPSILAVEFNRKKQTLISAIVGAVRTHPDAGPLVQTAYDALSLPTQTPPLPPDAFKLSLDGMNELLEIRVKQYVTMMPSTPQAERVPPVFFVLEPSRSLLIKDAALRVRTVQNMMTLLSLAAQHTATVPAGETRVQTIGLVTSYAGTLKILFGDAGFKQPAVAAKFDPIIRARDPIVAATLVGQVNEALGAVRALPEFKVLKDAPQVQGGS